MSSSSSTPTKDWLKGQLVSHGIPLPASSSKKEEYQRLYDEHVKDQTKNSEFSSDDDADQENGKPAPGTEKVWAWVKALNSSCLLDCLRASGKNAGPIVGSTRVLYEKLLYDIVKDKDGYTECMDRVIEFLRDNPEAKDRWSETPLIIEDTVFTNGAKVATNGNSDNGFSDSEEDDDLLETASRASRSSRASSKRRTPVPSQSVASPAPGTPKTGSGIGLYRTAGETNIKHRRSEKREMSTTMTTTTSEGGNADSVVTPRSTSNVKVIYSANLSNSQNSTHALPRRDFQTGEGTGIANRNLPVPNNRAAVQKKGAKAFTVLKYVGLFVLVVAVPVVGYMLKDYLAKNEGTEAPPQDELDQLLNSMNQQGI